MLVFHSAAETAGVEICVVDDAFIVFYARIQSADLLVFVAASHLS